jgi:hypothetical protein
VLYVTISFFSRLISRVLKYYIQQNTATFGDTIEFQTLEEPVNLFVPFFFFSDVEVDSDLRRHFDSMYHENH